VTFSSAVATGTFVAIFSLIVLFEMCLLLVFLFKKFNAPGVSPSCSAVSRLTAAGTVRSRVDLGVKHSSEDRPRSVSQDPTHSAGRDSRRRSVVKDSLEGKDLDSLLTEAVSAAPPAEWDVTCTYEPARVPTCYYHKSF